MTLRRKAFQSVAALLKSAANKPASSVVAARQPTFSAASEVAPLPQFNKFTGSSSRIALAFGAAALMTVAEPPTAMAQPKVVSAPNGSAADGTAPAESKQQYKVAFVLGGPGSGKGTQSARLVDEFGVVHLSAGDLLRAHMKSGTPDGQMVAEMIANGQIVPSSVTVGLLQSAMDASGNTKFLIDGFPRNEENRAAFEVQTGIQPSFVLFFDCPEEVMEARLLGRNEGRTDDNIETIRKRFKVFVGQSVPVVEHYEKQSKVARIRADRPPEEVYKEVRRAYVEFMV